MLLLLPANNSSRHVDMEPLQLPMYVCCSWLLQIFYCMQHLLTQLCAAFVLFCCLFVACSKLVKIAQKFIIANWWQQLVDYDFLFIFHFCSVVSFYSEIFIKWWTFSIVNCCTCQFYYWLSSMGFLWVIVFLLFFPPDHIPLDYILGNLPELHNLRLTYCTKTVGMNFYLGCNMISPQDMMMLARGLNDCHELEKFW